jgi:uncharacterized protein (TIGR00369 family)
MTARRQPRDDEKLRGSDRLDSTGVSCEEWLVPRNSTSLETNDVGLATTQEVAAFMASVFPRSRTTVREVGNRGATVVLAVGADQLRPGGTVSGPAMMAVADTALYVAVLGEIGIVPLAVTTSLSINFLRKPVANKDIVAVCKLMKLGKSLAVGEVSLYSEGSTAPVAHAVGTYSIPPGSRASD